MSGAEVALPIAMKGIQAASGAGGKGGGGGGSPGPAPEQAALAQYHFGENLLKNRARWAGSTPMSTGETFGAMGAHNQLAKEMAKASDQNQELQAQAGQQLQQIAQQQATQGQANQNFSSGVQSTQGGDTFST